MSGDFWRVLFFSQLLFTCHAWGTLGHALTATLSRRFVSQLAKDRLVNSTGYDLDVHYLYLATWADRVKHTRKYGFSARFHYADTHDAEPRHCRFSMENDCPDGGCVVGALRNYSTRLASSPSLDQRREAMRFVVHLVGDIHQPLHVSGREKGGNAAPTLFFDQHTNMHAVWDDFILERKFKIEKFSAYEEYADDLFERYVRPSVSYQTLGEHYVAAVFEFESWAASTNLINCDHVWPMYDETRGRLGETYYDSSIAVAEKQIMKGAINLGILLNSITGSSSANCSSLSPWWSRTGTARSSSLLSFFAAS